MGTTASTQYHPDTSLVHDCVALARMMLGKEIPLGLLCFTDSTWSTYSLPTWSGALPVKVEGSSKAFNCWCIGVKYGESLILSTRSLSPPSCFTTFPACWDNTRICSWHSYKETVIAYFYAPVFSELLTTLF